MCPLDSMSSETRSLSDKFMLRLPDGMRERIKRAAETNNRSMNAEIVATLDEAFPEVAPSMTDIMQDVMALGGLIQNMKDEDRKSAVRKKQQELQSRSALAQLRLQGSTLVLDFEGGDSTFQINLGEPPISY